MNNDNDYTIFEPGSVEQLRHKWIGNFKRSNPPLTLRGNEPAMDLLRFVADGGFVEAGRAGGVELEVVLALFGCAAGRPSA